MRIHISPLFLLLIAGAMALAVACGTTAAPSVNLTPTPGPAAPTPVPTADKTAAINFNTQLQSIDKDWNKFHEDFSKWQLGLFSCDRSTLQVALQDFAVGFNDITEEARSLPRASSTRDLADDLIAAAELQGTALRQLRDRWQPNDTSLFESVAAERSAASAAQKQVEDELVDLQQSTDVEDVEAVEELSTPFDEVKSDWESFNDDYDDLSSEQADLDTAAIVDRLTELVDQFSSIVSSVDDLPSEKAAESMAESLQGAAEEQNDALEELLATFEELNAAPVEEGADPEPHDTGLFDSVDTAVEDNIDLLEEVGDDIDAVLDDGSAEDAADIAAFELEYRSLLVTWDAFHARYDEWRRTEGGCDRTEAIEDLGRFGLQFDKIVVKVRDLPQTSALLPIGRLLSEAASREQEALRVLRNSWRPFGVDTYQALDQERASAARLRQQANGSIQELQSRYAGAQ